MFRIRLYKPSDLEAVYHLAEKYASFDSMPTMADVEGFYNRSPEFFHVAEDQSGKVVGFITGYERKGIPENVLQFWNAGKVGYIDLMAVDPSDRRKGAGTLLLNTLLKEFGKSGIDLVLLDVPAEQVPAVKMYQKLGFNVRAYNMVKPLKENAAGAGSGI